MRALNPDQLRSFADVVELGSFSAAAERLHLTQPAVSQQVRQLETRLGLKLVERAGRKVRPSTAGIELVAHIRRIEAVLEAALHAMAKHAKGAHGRVRIGTGATACIHLLPPVLRQLRRKLPGLELSVSTGNTADIVRLVEDNLVDIGLVTMPVRGRALSIAPLLEDEFVAIASPDARPLPAPLTPAALAEFHRILRPGGAVALLWNERDEADLCTAAYGAVMRSAPDAAAVEVPRGRAGEALLHSPLFREGRRVCFGNGQALDEEGLLGRAFSASYAPRQPEAAAAFADALRRVFARFQQAGKVSLCYQTSVYLARRREGS